MPTVFIKLTSPSVYYYYYHYLCCCCCLVFCSSFFLWHVIAKRIVALFFILSPSSDICFFRKMLQIASYSFCFLNWGSNTIAYNTIIVVVFEILPASVTSSVLANRVSFFHRYHVHICVFASFHYHICAFAKYLIWQRVWKVWNLFCSPECCNVNKLEDLSLNINKAAQK